MFPKVKIHVLSPYGSWIADARLISKIRKKTFQNVFPFFSSCSKHAVNCSKVMLDSYEGIQRTNCYSKIAKNKFKYFKYYPFSFLRPYGQIQSNVMLSRSYTSFSNEGQSAYVNDVSGASDQSKNAILDSIEQTITPEELLALSEKFLNDGTLHPHHLAAIILKYKTLVYQKMVPNLALKDESYQRKQIMVNMLSKKLVNDFVLNPYFQNVMKFCEDSLESLTLHESVLILNALHSLQLSNQSTILWKLYFKCCESIQKMNFNQLALFSSVLSNSSDFTAMSQVAERAKQCIHEDCPSDFKNICALFSNIKKIVSTDFYHLCAKKMLLILKQNPSQISLESLIDIIWFVKISKTECLEIIVNGMLSLPPESFQNIDIDKSNLTLDMALEMNGASWLCPLLRNLASKCGKVLSSDKNLTLEDVVKLGLTCIKIPFIDDGQAVEKLSKCIGELDSFFFIEFLQHYQYVQPFKKKLAVAFHDRLVKYLQDLDDNNIKLDIAEQDSSIAKSIYHFYLKFIEFEISIDKRIENSIYKIKEFNSTGWCWPKFTVRLTVKSAVEKLQSNNSLFPAELTSVMKVLRFLELDDLILINRNLEEISFSKILSKAVKHQSLQIRKTVLEIFYDSLNQTQRLTPTFTTRTALPPSLIYETRLGLLEPLLSSLPRFTSDKEEVNCIRILRILELTVEKFPIYQIDTFENLASFLKSRWDSYIYCSFQFIKAVSYAGYLPDDSSFFFTSSKQLSEKIIQNDMLEKRLQVELAYGLSLFGMYFDDLVNRIFSLDFLSCLDKELEDLSFKGAERIKKILINLSLSVALECPHLSVTNRNFSYNHKISRTGDEKHPVIEKIYHSLSRICGDSSWIQSKSFTSYGHSIYNILYVQNRQWLLKPEEGQQKLKAGEDIDRIVVLYLGKAQFCVNTDHLKGRMTAKIRQLEILGYIVVLVPYRDLSSMELQSQQNLDRYLQHKINSSTGYQLFTQLQDD